MTFLKMEYFAGFVFWFAAQFFIYRWLISRSKQAIDADKLQENDKDVKSDVLTNVSQSGNNIISLDMPSGTRLYPRMFPTNMPFESGVIVDYFVKSIFYNWKSRDSASKWCDRINEEFSRMEQRSKMLNYIYASNLDLGAVSPTIQNARILPTDPSRRDLVCYVQG